MTVEVPAENPTKLEDAIAIIKFLSDALTNEREEKEALKHRLQLMLRHRFGQRSEKFSPGQHLLNFPGMKEALAAAGIDESELQPAPKVEIEDKPEREGHGRRKLPEDLPRTEIQYDLPEDEKTCEACGGELDLIGEETSEQLEYIPGHFEVLRHKRLKYACKDKSCECTIKLAPKPETSIWKCLAGPGLLAHTLISKFDDHLPFYRQAEIIERLGMNIHRSTLCGWIKQLTRLLEPLYELMKQRVLQSKVIQTDDTSVKYQLGKHGKDDCTDLEGSTNGDANPKGKSKKKRIAKGYIWPYLGDANNPFVVFDFTTGRGGKYPELFLGDYRGYLQVDGYTAYDRLFEKVDDDGKKIILEVACWAHARRKFFDSLDTKDRQLAEEALVMIRELYEIEKSIKGETDEKKLKARQKRSKPLLKEFFKWLNTADANPSVLPKSPLRAAINYVNDNWPAFIRYTEQGYLDIDNNASERAIKSVVIGRKNWLFAGSEEGGKTAAIAYTMIESARSSGANVWDWLRFVIENIGQFPESRLSELLPDQWVSNQQESTPS